MTTGNLSVSNSPEARQVALSMTETLMKEAERVGALDNAFEAAESSFFSGEPLTERETGSLQMGIRTINRLIETRNKARETLALDSLEGIDALARDILENQFNAFNDRVENLMWRAMGVFSRVANRENEAVNELRGVFKAKVGQYLQSRDGKQLLEARELQQQIQSLQYRVSRLNDAARNPEGKKVEMVHQFTDEDMQMMTISRCIRPYLGVAQALVDLEAFSAEGKTVADLRADLGDPTLQIDEQIDKLHQFLGSSRVNYWVYQLSPEPKGGKNFGLEHRYDDLNRLKDAFKNAAKEAVAKLLKDSAQGLDQKAIFAQLFERIGSPDVENPEQWMQENACYYFETLQQVIDSNRFYNREIIPFDDGHFGGLDFELPLSTQGSSSSSSSHSHQLNFDIGGGRVKLQETRMLERLEALAQRKEPISEDLKMEINGLIEALHFSLKGNKIVNKYVFELSTDKKKGGPNWGTLHRYDDLDVLRRALMKAVSVDFHATVLSEHFDVKEVEEQDAFYAEISRLSGVEHGKDPVAWGKENIALYLDLMEEARTVCYRMKDQREAAARVNEEATGKVVYEFIKNNSQAKALEEVSTWISKVNPAAVEAAKAKIRHRVEKELDSKTRSDLFRAVWQLAGEPKEDKFGSKHYLDDLDRLDSAVGMVIINMAFGQ